MAQAVAYAHTRYAKSADVAFDIALETGDLTHATEYFNESRALREQSGSLSEPGFREQVVARPAQPT